jgi:hypothetical protein
MTWYLVKHKDKSASLITHYTCSFTTSMTRFLKSGSDFPSTLGVMVIPP